MRTDSITLNPVGFVKSQITDCHDMPLSGIQAQINVFPQFSAALERIEEYSHLWILTWFHKARRDLTTVVPTKVNPLSHKYGVFAIRSPVRPNPIALTLVKLEQAQDNILYVAGLDAIDGTPVLDIKPYFEHDVIFSARTPYIAPLKPELQKKTLLSQALTYHGEVCSDLLIAVRMAIVACDQLEYIKSLNVKVEVIGSPCLADTLQGLCRARLANPSRFTYSPATEQKQSIWTNGIMRLTLTCLRELDEAGFWGLTDQEVFDITLEENETP
ncbi:MAG: tRNA (N6-threonylcarbamoyladenosine(37)-N6)-methyltransferase TrmO [Desulfosporosinus sp.]|jgi:tRNA-Thr(GGU) m(6)t(6)A37 methyltransferase TsaA